MDTCSPIQCRYQTIVNIAERMLCCARSNHWNEVALLANEYTAAVELLRASPTLSEQSRAERQALLTRILDADAAIRALISPEMGRLGKLLGDLRRQRHVLDAYSGRSVQFKRPSRLLPDRPPPHGCEPE